MALLDVTVFVFTRPFSYFMRTCSVILKISTIIVITWCELLKTSINVHLNIFWSILMWIIAFVSLPGRILAALQRERQLRQYLQFMEIEFDNLLWERKELQRHFQAAIKEHKMMELMLDELEVIHEKATNKIALLESEVQNLRNENLRAREVQGKGYWSLKDPVQKTGRVDNTEISHVISSRSSSYGGSSIVQDLIQSDAWKDDEDVAEVLDEQREVAVSRSLFSTVLSLLVGVVMWQAEESHLCLVVALLSVVSISLKSVVEFFTTIKNKPALDAVALLSVNWFVLGILAYPTLPTIAGLLAPLASRFVSN